MVYIDTCSLARNDPLAKPDCTQKVGHPDLLSSVFRRSKILMCSISKTCGSAVTKFALWVHLTWMQRNVGFDLLSRVTWGQNVQIKFWENQGGTSRNHCTQILVLLHAQTHYRTDRSLIAHQKLGHPDFLYSSKSPTDKTGRE